MKVSELIKELQLLPQGLQVRISADHGQTPMASTWIGEGYIDEDSYMPEELSQEDVQADPESYGDAIKVVIIQGY